MVLCIVGINVLYQPFFFFPCLFLGVRNLTALGNLITWQKVDYDFSYHQMEFPCNINVLVTSEGRSLLPVSIPSSSSSGRSCGNAPHTPAYFLLNAATFYEGVWSLHLCSCVFCSCSVTNPFIIICIRFTDSLQGFM